MDTTPLRTHRWPQDRALSDNAAFDAAVTSFLEQWLAAQAASGVELPRDEAGNAIAPEKFLQEGALQHFFKTATNPMARLLANEAIARHLLRPVERVHLQDDAYEPLLAHFERRIYNLAANRAEFVPFRYTLANNQNAWGDTSYAVGKEENIGMYFGTRRSDQVALSMFAEQFLREVERAATPNMHIINAGYIQPSLEEVKKKTRQLGKQGEKAPQLFFIFPWVGYKPSPLGGSSI